MAISNDAVMSVISPICGPVKVVEHHGDTTFIIPKEHITAVCTALRDNPSTQFAQLLDVTAVDLYDKHPRFEVVYFLHSLEHAAKIRLKVAVEEAHPYLPTMCDVWESANWYERETFDMYGIQFEGHPDLRRFYMPEDFVDPETGEPLHPLRKDFPLMGIPGSLVLPEKFPDLNA